MFPRLPIPYLQPFSFFVGFFAGIIFIILLSRARPLLGQMRAGAKEKRESAKLRGSSNVEESLRKQTLKYAQGQHLAASLFSLDEILQPVRLIAPPPILEPEGVIPLEDAISQSVPYLPAWPEVAATYNVATLSLSEALSGGSNLVLIGQPGCGKSVALAHLASLAARKDDSLGELAEYVPVFIHAADLALPLKNPNDLLTPISDILSAAASMFVAGRIPGFMEYVFKSGRALLLIDGLDELHPEGVNVTSEYVLAILKAYPKTRVVTTGSLEYVGGLIKLGFTPLGLTAWNTATQTDFLGAWTELWEQYVSMEAWSQTGPDPVDSILLNEWLMMDTSTLTPLEFTLKVWGAYAGDARGPNITDAIETHIYRLSPMDIPQEALHILAMQTTATAQPVFDPRKARAWVKSFEPEEVEEIAESVVVENQEEISTEDAAEESKGEKQKAKKEKKTKKSKVKIEAPKPSSSLLAKLSDSGLLITLPNNRMRFMHPTFANYLAGRALATYGTSTLQEQHPWAGKNGALYYAAAYGDIGKIAQQQISNSKKPLQLELLTAARWLQAAPRQAAWRGPVFAALATLIQDETSPLGLRAQAITAMALSYDPSVNALFRQLMQNSTSVSVIQVAALGAGLARDTKAIPNLAALIHNPTTGIRRASCLALVAIGTEPALEVVASALLTGDEDLRRVAAEALANHPQEGHEMLREGAGMEDILVRRSVVYGLGRVHQPWADQLLAKMQVEDEQWVVRTAATEVLDSLENPNPRVPHRLQPAHSTPWVIQFAGKQGMGVSPGQDPTDLLMLALKSEILEEQMAALAYLRLRPTPGILRTLYNLLYSNELEMREAAFYAIDTMALGGIKLPDPMEYGLG